MTSFKIKSLIVGLMALNSFPVYSDAYWYVKPIFGLSQMSDTSGTTSNVGTFDGTISIDLESGFTPGISVGKKFNENWSTDVAWEYRTNDSETTIADGTQFPDGNYASSVFSFNGYYHFDSNGKWRPYIGAGLMLGQEIDIDLEINGEELSYTNDGETGLQVMLGSYYEIDENWAFNGELRYGQFSSIDLEGEGNNGLINGLDYEPLTIGIGIEYRF